MVSLERILIIGGGIGGLALALALEQAGMNYLVLEQAPVLREVGAGLGVWSNALRLLERLGAGSRVRAQANPISLGAITNQHGKLLTAFSIRDLTGEDDSALYIMRRADLHQAIAAGLPQSRVRLSARVSRVTHDGEEATAWMADGTTLKANLVVGADGLRSVVRSSLFGDAPPDYSGETCWRGIAQVSQVNEKHILREIQGNGLRAGICPLDDRRVYLWLTEVLPEGHRLPLEETGPYLMDRFRGWPHDLPFLLSQVPEGTFLRNDLYDRAPLPTWHEGCITILGDAAHPTTPNLGQGACMAIEDAMVLARQLLSQDSLEDALYAYHAERAPRTSSIVRYSRQWGKIGRWRHPAGIWFRETMARATPRWIITRTWRELTGYDAGQLPLPESLPIPQA